MVKNVFGVALQVTCFSVKKHIYGLGMCVFFLKTNKWIIYKSVIE